MEQKDLENLTIEELSILSAQGFKCDNERCPHYEKYHQCYNHSHVLCPEYVKFYKAKNEVEVS